MFKIGEFVSFHSTTEDFDWVNDVERLLDDLTVYEIMEVIDNKTIAVLNESGNLIKADIADYQIHTKESLKQLLTSRNHKYAAICNKVRQLYYKQEFQFKGI
jgi:hypothetical protein